MHRTELTPFHLSAVSSLKIITEIPSENVKRKTLEKPPLLAMIKRKCRIFQTWSLTTARPERTSEYMKMEERGRGEKKKCYPKRVVKVINISHLESACWSWLFSSVPKPNLESRCVCFLKSQLKAWSRGSASVLGSRTFSPGTTSPYHSSQFYTDTDWSLCGSHCTYGPPILFTFT